MDTAKRLRQYNRWRRGLDDWDTEEGSPNPEELGKLIDQAVIEIEAAQLLYEAAETLRKQKGRHNTEIAYHRLTEALSAYKLRTAMPANVQGKRRAACGASERPKGAFLTRVLAQPCTPAVMMSDCGASARLCAGAWRCQRHELRRLHDSLAFGETHG